MNATPESPADDYDPATVAPPALLVAPPARPAPTFAPPAPVSAPAYIPPAPPAAPVFPVAPVQAVPEAPRVEGSRKAPPSLGQKIWRRVATRQFLFVSIALHLLFGGVATVYIVQTTSGKRKQTFTAAPPSANPGARATEHRVQMAQKQRTMSAPPLAKRVTTTATNTAVALPPAPVMPVVPSTVTPAKMGGMGGAGFGLAPAGATGMGSGSGGGGGPMPFFGFRKSTGGGSFVGSFYDYKQDKGGQPTRFANLDKPSDGNAEAAVNALETKEVGQLANGGFSEGSLANYFKGPDTLYATQIYVPTIQADKGPEAFNLANKVRPKRWIVLYRASVTPSESGRYHFVGKADDFLIVRLNHRLVLDGSIQVPTGKKPAKTYKMAGVIGPTAEVAIGESFEVSASEHYDMEVLIGELPGGQFSVFLQLEKEGVEYAKDSAGCPILPLFKLAPSEVAAKGDNMPEIAKDTSWSMWRADKSGSGSIFSR